MGWNPFKQIKSYVSNPIDYIKDRVEKHWERNVQNPFQDIGNAMERWNPMPQIKMPTIPGPTPEQLAAQAAQTKLLTAQAAQLEQQKANQTATEASAEASARARRARMAGRNSLLLDEVGIIDGTRPMQAALGA
jgi:hypothetical protein